ncbi:MAG: ABC transporter permease [Actinomycetota bacterium]
MRTIITLICAGLPVGAMYALQAMGIVLVYKTSRVFNFAQGAIGMTAAYVAHELGVAIGLPVWIAFFLALAFAGALGMVMERLTIRPVKGPLPRTIVTLGWLLLLRGAVGWRFGEEAARAPLQLFSQTSFALPGTGVRMSIEQAAILGAALLIALGLGAYFRTSNFGTAMRAVADDVPAARLLGLKVDRINMVAWGLGSMMAGLAGILLSPSLGALTTTGLVVLTIQALAAALVGGLNSLPLTFAGGIGLGIAQKLVTNWWHPPGSADQAVAFAVVLGALLLRRQRAVGRVGGLLPESRRVVTRALAAKRSQAGLALAGTLVVAGLVVPLIGGAQWNYNLVQMAAWALAVLSIVILAGDVGQVSLCQGSFMAMGAFAAAAAVAVHVPFGLAIVVGGFGAMAMAVLVGLPALRLQGLELAIVTLSLAFMGDRFLFLQTWITGSGSARALPRPEFTRVSTHGVAGARWYTLITFAALLLLAWGVRNLRRSRTGSAFAALRSSVEATRAMGFSATAYKLDAFAVSGFIAGIAGALFSGLVGTAAATSFDFTRSISLLAFAVIAGVGSIPGAILGGVVVMLSTLGTTSTSMSSASAGAVTTMLTGGGLIAVVALSPGGVADLIRSGADRLLRRGGEETPVEGVAA